MIVVEALGRKMKRNFKKIYINNLYKKIIIWLILLAFNFSFIVPPATFAQVNFLPAPGSMVVPTSAFMPVILRGVKIHPENPFRFDFIVDGGDANLNDEAFKQESYKLVKYFLASLTIPEENLWVNLSPHERNRIIPDELGQTDMGKDMLAADYILKQLTASLMYPEKDLGKRFWNNIYKKAYESYGTTDIPVDTFHKVWIVPEKAVVYELDDRAIIGESSLKVMLEEEYLAFNGKPIANSKNQNFTDHHYTLSTDIIKQIIIPEIEKEVNTGKNFAQLRQIYQGLILAAWYKRAFKNSFLSKAYVNQQKINGVDIPDKNVKEEIYDQYLKAFKLGVYNYIKEDYDPKTKSIVPRKYFSGGLELHVDRALTVKRADSLIGGQIASTKTREVAVNLNMTDFAMASQQKPEAKEILSYVIKTNGVFTKRYMNELVVNALEQGQSLQYLTLKIQNFKFFNTLGGHVLGDIVLNSITVYLSEYFSRFLDDNIEVKIAQSGPTYEMIFLGINQQNQKTVQNIVERLFSNADFYLRADMLKEIRKDFLSLPGISPDAKKAVKNLKPQDLNFYGGLSEIFIPEGHMDTNKAVSKASQLQQQSKKTAKYAQFLLNPALYSKIISDLFLLEEKKTKDDTSLDDQKIKKSVQMLIAFTREINKSGLEFFTDELERTFEFHEKFEDLKNEYNSGGKSLEESYSQYEKRNMLLYPLVQKYELLVEQYEKSSQSEAENIMREIKDLEKKMIEINATYFSSNLDNNRKIFLGSDNFRNLINATLENPPQKSFYAVFRLGEFSDEYGVLLWHAQEEKLAVFRVDGNNIGKSSVYFGNKVGDGIIDLQLQTVDSVFAQALTLNKSMDNTLAEVDRNLGKQIFHNFDMNNLPDYIKKNLKKSDLNLPVDYPLTVPELNISLKSILNGKVNNLDDHLIWLLGQDKNLYQLKFKIKGNGLEGFLVDETGNIVTKDYKTEHLDRAPPSYQLPNIKKVNFRSSFLGVRRLRIIGPVLKIEKDLFHDLKNQGKIQENNTVNVQASPSVSAGYVVIKRDDYLKQKDKLLNEIFLQGLSPNQWRLNVSEMMNGFADRFAEENTKSEIKNKELVSGSTASSVLMSRGSNLRDKDISRLKLVSLDFVGLEIGRDLLDLVIGEKDNAMKSSFDKELFLFESHRLDALRVIDLNRYDVLREAIATASQSTIYRQGKNILKIFKPTLNNGTEVTDKDVVNMYKAINVLARRLEIEYKGPIKLVVPELVKIETGGYGLLSPYIEGEVLEDVMKWSISLEDRKNGNDSIQRAVDEFIKKVNEITGDMADVRPSNGGYYRCENFIIPNEYLHPDKYEIDIRDNLIIYNIDPLNMEKVIKRFGKDKALTADKSSQNVGGIDFNSNRLDLKVEGAGRVFSGQNFENMNPNDIKGLVPVIINITPVSNFNNFLGFSDSKQEAIKS